MTEVDSSHNLLELSPGFLLGHAPVGHEVICEVKENTGLWTQGLLVLLERAGEWEQCGHSVVSSSSSTHGRGTGRDRAHHWFLTWAGSEGKALTLILYRGQLRGGRANQNCSVHKGKGFKIFFYMKIKMKLFQPLPSVRPKPCTTSPREVQLPGHVASFLPLVFDRKPVYGLTCLEGNSCWTQRAPR